MVQEYEHDPKGAALEFRKHLGWYVRGLPNSAAIRRRLHAVQSFDEVEGIFREYVASEWMERAAADAAHHPTAPDADGGDLPVAREPAA